VLHDPTAISAAPQGAAVVGVRAKDAVILAVEKRAAAKLQVRGVATLQTGAYVG
jgi:20S proteasome alpha/beta subunit